jgi:hypothetical protein
MRRAAFVLIVLASAAATVVARAQVVEDNFQLRNTGDLVALCSSQSTDRMFTAAQNFRHGFAVGTYRSLLAAQTAQPDPLFCPPAQVPTRSQAITEFVQWANASPARQQLSGRRQHRGVFGGEVAMQASSPPKVKEEGDDPRKDFWTSRDVGASGGLRRHD